MHGRVLTLDSPWKGKGTPYPGKNPGPSSASMDLALCQCVHTLALSHSAWVPLVTTSAETNTFALK